ncbi:MAG TPA: hypothetical protein VFX97_08790 [Pyrinomonadaceae bacterium]|nr:hypothetical protein [Pyrinomonadaceae bacterium]
MTRRRKFVLALLVILALSQTPFAYRRYRLKRLQNTIQQLASQRSPNETASEYIDYKGVIHVHTALGGHSSGTFAELIAAAKSNDLDFVIMTEHPQAEFDTAAMTLSGVHAGILFVNGNEVATADGDRLLLIPAPPNANERRSTKDVVDQQKANQGLAFAAYPTESSTWQANPVDGVEIYNLFTNTKRINRLVTFFDGLWSYRSYPDLMFANFFARPTEDLKRWDEAMSSSNRRLVAVGGNDAHSNVGFGLTDATGRQLVGVKLDPYERSFRTVRTHVLVQKDKPLTRESLLEALSLGHCYVSFDIFGDAAGFDFRALQSQAMMGDETAYLQPLELIARAPVASRFVLLRNGVALDQSAGTTVRFPVTAAGIYRVEVYLDSLPPPGTGKPWILSNPIYVR